MHGDDVLVMVVSRLGVENLFSGFCFYISEELAKILCIFEVDIEN